MPRYFKLGASKGADRDTSLFQDHAAHHGPGSQQQQQQHGAAGKWAPSLRRAQSSRERPVVAPPPLQQEQYSRGSRFEEEEEEDAEDEMEDRQDRRRKSVSSPPGAAAFLRRAMSSREQHHQFHQQRRHDLCSRRDGGELLGPLEAAVQRGFALKKPPGGFEQQSPAAKQVSRAQSMRYNRIVSSNDDNDEQLTPPRHSSFAGYGRHHGGGGGAAAAVAAPPRSWASAKSAKKRVVVSASYQTGEGEILSIECAKCGRWLGTVAHSVNLDEGMIKLCQICHPPLSEQQQQTETTVPSPASKKGSSFVRGIRRMLGLKKRQGAAAAPLGSPSPPPVYNNW